MVLSGDTDGLPLQLSSLNYPVPPVHFTLCSQWVYSLLLVTSWRTHHNISNQNIVFCCICLNIYRERESSIDARVYYKCWWPPPNKSRFMHLTYQHKLTRSNYCLLFIYTEWHRTNPLCRKHLLVIALQRPSFATQNEHWMQGKTCTCIPWIQKYAISQYINYKIITILGANYNHLLHNDINHVCINTNGLWFILKSVITSTAGLGTKKIITKYMYL